MPGKGNKPAHGGLSEKQKIGKLVINSGKIALRYKARDAREGKETRGLVAHDRHILASAILGWGYCKARIADTRLPALVEQCKASAVSRAEAAPIPAPSHGHTVPPSDVIPSGSMPIPPGAIVDPPVPDMKGVSDPNTLVGFEGYGLKPVQQQIADFAQDARNRTAWPLPIAAFAVFCLPLIWYFLLIESVN
jgi:hypothetical protein